MPRDELLKGRASLACHAYHVTVCTNRRQPLFADFAKARLAVAAMRRLDTDGFLDSLAWVVMPDHVHWLFQLGERGSLSETMKRFKGRSARTINDLANRQGAVWQRGFHDHGLRRDEDLCAVARYIVANPLRAGLVTRIGDYSLWDAVWL